jgi:iron complex transport system ATP-binding protein
MNALLTSNVVSFAYARRPVLQGVSLAVGTGEFVGLVGANDSGKTTLLRVLLGVLPPTTGEVRLCGATLGSLTRREIALRATMVHQDTRIDFAFTAREIVAMGRTPYLRRFTPETRADKEAIDLAMRATETEDFADRFVTELSGGERQRVHLARALAQNSEVLLLDEPTANLDLAHQFETLCLIRQMTRQGKAALAAIHDLSLAARFCDRLLLLYGGQIVAAGPPAEVVTESNLARYFALHARVWHDKETGGLVILPLSAARQDPLWKRDQEVLEGGRKEGFARRPGRRYEPGRARRAGHRHRQTTLLDRLAVRGTRGGGLSGRTSWEAAIARRESARKATRDGTALRRSDRSASTSALSSFYWAFRLSRE